LILNSSQFNYLPINTLAISIVALHISYLIYSTLYIKYDINFSSYCEFINYLDSYSNIQIIGQSLFLFYFFPFLLVGLLLMVAMIGVILLTLSHYKIIKRQVILMQNLRRISLS